MNMKPNVSGRSNSDDSGFSLERVVSPSTASLAVSIEFQNIRHSFMQGENIVDVLDQVSMNVSPGEFVGIVGPSGCGKTTLLGLAAAMLQPRAGTVFFDGQPLIGASEGVAYMLARDALLPWRSAIQNVELALEVHGIGKQERRERAMDWLSRLGLGKSANVNVRRLSHGMRQRVAIARTLAQSPRCVLMDEPFAALDAQTRIHVQKEFLALWESERPTVLFVTHDLAEAILLSDRVLLMSRAPGRIVGEMLVPLSRPRDPELDRSKPAFLDCHERLWEQLKTEYGAGS